jgi:hypothetical protein
MTLVDTSVWVEHFRRGVGTLGGLLEGALVLCHPFIIGELACGGLPKRREYLMFLGELPQVPLAEHAEVLMLVEEHELMVRGIGWIDAHLLTSTMLAGVALWTFDRSLAGAARSLGVLATP